MNPIVLLFLISILAKARTRRDRLKAIMVILTVCAQQQGRVNLAHLRRMARHTSDDALLVHLIAALREEPTGVNDPHNSDLMRRIKKGSEIQFRRMFRVSRLVFEAVLAELHSRSVHAQLRRIGSGIQELQNVDVDAMHRNGQQLSHVC